MPERNDATDEATLEALDHAGGAGVARPQDGGGRELGQDEAEGDAAQTMRWEREHGKDVRRETETAERRGRGEAPVD
jgi:hypothetical protein